MKPMLTAISSRIKSCRRFPEIYNLKVWSNSVLRPAVGSYEEEDPEVVAEREKRLADYKKKKEGKAKPAAIS